MALGVFLGCPSALFAQTESAPRSAQEKAPEANDLTFDVVSIHLSNPESAPTVQWGLPDSYRAMNQPLLTTIVLAYFPPQSFVTKEQLVFNAPDWVMYGTYDIEAKVAANDIPRWQKQGPNKEMMGEMLRSALADRCKLAAHYSTSERPIYALVVEKRGARLEETASDTPPPAGVPLSKGGVIVPYKRGAAPKVHFFGASMASLADFLSTSSDRIVVDETRLTGKYNFELTKRGTTEGPDYDLPSSGEWDEGKLGLKLVPAKAPLRTLTIDHVEKPTEN